MPRADEGRNGMPGSSWGRSTERFGSTTQGYNPPSRGLSQYLQGRLQRNKKRRTLADYRGVILKSTCNKQNVVRLFLFWSCWLRWSPDSGGSQFCRPVG